MVIVKLKGGLGDQMFRYAAALGIRREGESLYADLHALFDRDSGPEGYQLGVFPELHLPKVPNLVHRIFNTGEFPWSMLRSLLRARFRRVVQHGSQLNPRLLQRRHSLYLDGPFHNPGWFGNHRAQLLSDFRFAGPDEAVETLAAAMGSRKDAVAVTIFRGGDDANTALAGPPPDYYLQCLAAIRGQGGQAHFYLFTDDPAWARQQLGVDETEASIVSTGLPPATQMYLKTQCAHHITAGTAEDWWGAWLSQRKGMNFAPEIWFGNGSERTSPADLMPADWTIVPLR